MANWWSARLRNSISEYSESNVGEEDGEMAEVLINRELRKIMRK